MFKKNINVMYNLVDKTASSLLFQRVDAVTVPALRGVRDKEVRVIKCNGVSPLHTVQKPPVYTLPSADYMSQVVVLGESPLSLQLLLILSSCSSVLTVPHSLRMRCRLTFSPLVAVQYPPPTNPPFLAYKNYIHF